MTQQAMMNISSVFFSFFIILLKVINTNTCKIIRERITEAG